MTISHRTAPDAHETELVLAAVPSTLDPAHRERLEQAIATVKTAVAQLETAIAAAAVTPQVVPAEAG